MLIDFYQDKIQQFLACCEQLMQCEDLKLYSVADFYAASWLNDFPQGTTWRTSGLDDGAEEFYAVIEFRGYRLTLDVGQTTQLKLLYPVGAIKHSTDLNR
ncbi:hypothetical protein [uncultured Acinetobacter sp.]|uniref:hypothetical protein n=1 Tax=uncultured Acinetobacter sp. TaxID=165433 RepID=UPI00261B45BF|nr:hypothetical protein [uncultured Acinetobacter sp.]